MKFFRGVRYGCPASLLIWAVLGFLFWIVCR